MLERIRTLLTARQLTPTQFADTIGVSRPIVSHILSGRNKPSLEVVQKIIGAFPDLSLLWLLNGEGPMLAPQTLTAPVAPSQARQVAPEPARAVASPQPAPERTVPAAIPAAAPAPEPASLPVAVPVAPPEPTAESRTVTEVTPTFSSMFENKVVTPIASAAASAPAPADAALAQGLAEPGKRIRRIVIFYQDGTFADYQPDATA
ncbi:helix-turn-helix domain-containing protein [Hymenobacter rigui]|uniref:XRE family transcriptional regulator n=1 Tax=Hymenobacter rigui TaxID=334424 RepID=A0A428KU31_9BACT|nr:helix-turn-helix transcriptional regulator [Hymenobacter rigui]RSK50205.1 XRE family transcriptional regulator [Hymenobacter rigui]